MPHRLQSKPDEAPNRRTKRSTIPEPPGSDPAALRLVKSHPTPNETSSDGPDFGKITVVHYEVAPDPKPKPDHARPTPGENHTTAPFAYR